MRVAKLLLLLRGTGSKCKRLEWRLHFNTCGQMFNDFFICFLIFFSIYFATKNILQNVRATHLMIGKALTRCRPSNYVETIQNATARLN